MDGRGRAFDNIFFERLWRSVKHEEIYTKDYTDVWEAKENIGRYFRFYNQQCLHEAPLPFDYRMPKEVYLGVSGAGKSVLYERSENHLKIIKFLSKEWGRFTFFIFWQD